MSPSALLPILVELERELQQPATRGNPARLAELLHPEFIEFGYSGRAYDLRAIVEHLQQEQSVLQVLKPLPIHAQEFEVRVLAEGLALLTYKSAHIGHAGQLERHSLRSSLWKLAPRGWQVVFHQGTPTCAFARNAP